MSTPARLEIIGGGLAGLALGGALARAGVAACVLEAGDYPRHRVCGEFVCGLREETVRLLQLREPLADARQHREIAWHWRGRLVRRDALPRPAWGLSRHALDHRLAHAFVQAGGTLQTRARVPLRDTRPGRVWCTGRRTGENRWLGLKVHCRELPTAADLEFHFGDGAYVGLSGVEDGNVNVCGLFRRRPRLAPRPPSILHDYLEASGLGALAARISGRELAATRSAVGAITFDRRAPADRLVLGDAFAMIPPFTGDGMAMALESAALAAPWLERYARGQLPWEQAVRAITRACRERFRRRLRLGGILQRLLVTRSGQVGFVLLARSRLLPFRTLFHQLH